MTKPFDDERALMRFIEAQAATSAEGMLEVLNKLMSMYLFLGWPPHLDAAEARFGVLQSLLASLRKQLDHANDEHERNCPHGESCPNHRRHGTEKH